MTDRLEALLAHSPLSARAFHAGAVCGIRDLEDGEGGYLHLIRSGTVEVLHDGAAVARIEEPSLLLYPLAQPHRFRTDPRHGADLACARLLFDGGAGHPIAAALPAFTCLPLRTLPGGDGVLALLFEEAFARNCGRQAMLDRLFEVVLIQVLRQLMEDGRVQAGPLAGLAHPRLRHALAAMHAEPARGWSLETLAACAGMSRSAFANAFRDTVGCPPGAYLQRWRLDLARKAMRQGWPLKRVAMEVGYGSETALSRAFKVCSGLSPRQWRRMQEAG
ncbi:AraC family transcriptional regulator [Pseudoxanthomonas broegbernensis]|uniref:AraC family transcriptional regulator n=1 Tax=Pseudoxanthomonas broegbernensis TaxID=83619 RepID=A0A7V8GNW3_9GAMM|nr:AraC family transcriptional regulator [Pseudoxanthomonas broegbernensis]KAF1687363.1 AraC family transcriptional regulator [Pseudoxanthomonas broegbernensis]MBB6065634.1 AraC-like DNA-binding protein [Pseudoxanthomonas broegbernensis]